ncbi:MAG: metallophosphoesterase [Pseudomonadales bacterium]|nr:metallophosphoesterase [Pseudomonadales bacterium]
MTTYLIGDLHGHLNDYRRLLREQELIDHEERWCGGTDTIWLIGDFFDRGVHGIECIELTMRLQAEAAAAGGRVGALLGNHEMMMLCVHRFGDQVTSSGMRVVDQWRMWGGIESDLARLEDRHVRWLRELPMMAQVEDTLLIHADATFYVEYGRNIEAVNQPFRRLVCDGPLPHWENALRAFAEHRAFSALGMTGQQRAEQLLRLFGARRLVHGHTPIPLATGEAPASVKQAWTYANGRCINVDGGIYLGGPGFVHRLDQ